jgi:hypothetical protein
MVSYKYNLCQKLHILCKIRFHNQNFRSYKYRTSFAVSTVTSTKIMSLGRLMYTITHDVTSCGFTMYNRKLLTHVYNASVHSRASSGYTTKFLVHPEQCNNQTCVPIVMDTANTTRGKNIVATNYEAPYCRKYTA